MMPPSCDRSTRSNPLFPLAEKKGERSKKKFVEEEEEES